MHGSLANLNVPRRRKFLNTIRVGVLANGVSEGPDFAALRDYKVFTIYYVGVVAYVTDVYFRGFLRPETTVKCRLAWLCLRARGVSEREGFVRSSSGRG